MSNDETEPQPQANGGDTIRAAMLAIGGVGSLSALVASFGWGFRAGLGVAIGALVAVANLWTLRRIGAAMLSGKSGSKAAWAMAALLKFAALVGLFWLLMRYRLVGAVPLIVGYGALPVGITLATLLSARYEREA